MDLPNEKLGCHRTGFAKKCRSLVVSGKCNRWYHVQGTDPNIPDSRIDMYDCVDNWMPKLTIENSLQQRQTAASVDKVATEIADFRDRMLKLNEQTYTSLRESHTINSHDSFGPFIK